MHTELLELFARYMEKQEILSKLTEDIRLYGYSYSEIHTIAAIEDLPEPNVTEIARHLNVTRGAISKITKKLLTRHAIEAYQEKGNKQKIFFRLTTSGRFLYEAHQKRHELWLQRDEAFLRQFDEATLEQLEQFMTAFNGYLEQQIRQLGGKHAELQAPEKDAE